jgi:hypothetical protein
MSNLWSDETGSHTFSRKGSLPVAHPDSVICSCRDSF